MLKAKANDQGHKRKCFPKKNSKNFSDAPQIFNNSKNVVLELRIGQFLRTWGLEAKELTFEAKDKANDIKMCLRGRPRGLHLWTLKDVFVT